MHYGCEALVGIQCDDYYMEDIKDYKKQQIKEN